MATVRFVIRSEKKDAMVDLQIRFSTGSSMSFYVKSGWSVPVDAWLNPTQRFTSKFLKMTARNTEYIREVTNGIIEVKAVILSAYNKLTTEPSKKWLEEVVHSFHNPTVSIEKAKVTFIAFIDLFISDIKRGIQLTSENKRYEEGSIRTYVGFHNRFVEFCKLKRIDYDFDDITEAFYKDFVLFLVRKDYSGNTIGRHIKELKSLMRLSRTLEYHTNIKFEKFKVLTAEVKSVYLNETELIAIKALDLSTNVRLERVRDLFLIGCYTAQRFSDYSSIRSEDIHSHPDGKITIELIQKKTNAKVVIPAHPEALEILAKYDNTSPKITPQKFNNYIKDVAKMAGITELITVSETIGAKRVDSTKPKYELISSHTARRSGATNMYLAKIPTLSIMKITGHKTEKDFMKYIRISEHENAAILANHPFYNKK